MTLFQILFLFLDLVRSFAGEEFAGEEEEDVVGEEEGSMVEERREDGVEERWRWSGGEEEMEWRRGGVEEVCPAIYTT